MAKLKWDQSSERLYETGIDRGVLYLQNSSGNYPSGVSWNGLASVSENPTGGEPESIYADNVKYLNLSSIEECEGSIEAYSYPDEWMKCDGNFSSVIGLSFGQQQRSTFGLCYRSMNGDDTEGVKYGYKLHLIYGCLASPSEKTYQTINDSPEANSFSWDYSSTPVSIEGAKATSLIIIDSTKLSSARMSMLENLLYGTDNTDPYLPLPREILELLRTANIWYNTENGDLVVEGIELFYNSTTGDLTTDPNFIAYDENTGGLTFVA